MKTSLKIIHWTPRILCILAILFVSMFALDSFDPRMTPGQQLQAFAIHLVPTYVLVFFLIIAWKWELIGGLMFMILALGFTPLIYMHNYNMNHSVMMTLSIVLMLLFPFVLTGGLFVFSHFLKKKNQSSSAPE